MAIRRYTIKDTKSPTMYISLFEASKGVVQASTLGLRPKKPDFDAIGAEMKASPGLVVGYELSWDGKLLGFEVSWGKKRESLARIDPAATFSGDALTEVMQRLVKYGLVTTKELASKAAQAQAKAKELQAAIDKVERLKAELKKLTGG
jgi:hypothetical protein